jgi:hypothetical protein
MKCSLGYILSIIPCGKLGSLYTFHLKPYDCLLYISLFAVYFRNGLIMLEGL